LLPLVLAASAVAAAGGAAQASRFLPSALISKPVGIRAAPIPNAMGDNGPARAILGRFKTRQGQC
jgi:hypothetical protein